jgi:hypothetical protein
MLTSDTTWTKTGGPYVLAGVVGVDEGVTLTVESGVTVNFGSYYLEVKGTLCARGASNDKIVFEATDPLWGNKRVLFTDSSTNWNEQTETGNIIENADLNFISVSIGHTSPKISNNYFHYPSIGDMISVSGGSPLISNNTLIFDGNGIYINDGSPVISDNYIQGSSSSTGITTSNSGNGEVIIVRNTIVNNRYGIDSPVSSQIIEGNVFQNNQVGINGGGTILNNTIENGEISIRKPFTQAIIRYNNIIGYSQNSIYMTQSCPDVDATYNWWGTTDIEAIEQSIYDVEDDYHLSKVTFEPFLTELNLAVTSPIEGPSQPVTPSPTPTPEQTPTPTATPMATPTPSAIPVPGQSYFYVESNSTVSDLFFNSTSAELLFTVTGEAGTAGYAKVTIAKSLVSSIQDARVFLDGSQLSVLVTEDGDVWLLHFTYMHSEHHVTVTLGSVPFDMNQIGQALVIFLPLVAVVLFFAVTKLRNRKTENTTADISSGESTD